MNNTDQVDLLENRNMILNSPKNVSIDMPDNPNQQPQSPKRSIIKPSRPYNFSHISQAHTNPTTDPDNQNWPTETQTFISATTDMSHFSQENLAKFPKEKFSKLSCDSQFISTVFVTLLAYVSPILFILIPVFKGNLNVVNSSCYGHGKTDCQTDILSIVLKLVILSISSYWLLECVEG